MYLTHLRLLSVIKDKMIPSVISKYNSAMSKTYEEAVNCLNSLQSNQSYIQNAASKGVLPHSAIHSTTIAETQKYLLRTGVTLEDLDKLSVIHVAGTKGKGSTCAFCESIIRQYGYKTGFYSSPHLVAVRERIKLNGIPLSKEVFAENVFDIYNKLMDQRDHDNDMPVYFRFLTIVAFNIFIKENVDVAIIEVGIGGEYDCTNIIRNTPIVGITSLGLDHTSLLGSTLEQIAWQKSGIMKENSKVCTVQQPKICMKAIQNRSVEKKISCLEIAPDFNTYKWSAIPSLGIGGTVQKINASLAIQLAHKWLKFCGKNISTVEPINGILNDNLHVSNLTKIGLESCKWPGRNQVLKTELHTFYLDGAHTTDSLELCAEWFKNQTHGENTALIFNATGDRNSEDLLHKLSRIRFKRVMFVPNTASSRTLADHIKLFSTSEQQIQRCKRHKTIWKQKYATENVNVFSSVEDAIKSLDTEYNVLITGSLHLVGAALSILDADLKTF